MQEIYFSKWMFLKSCSCNEYFRPRTMCFRAEPLLFFKGGLVIFGKLLPRCIPNLHNAIPVQGQDEFPEFYTRTHSAKKKITRKMHEIWIKAQHPWGHVSHQHHIEVLLRILLRILLFSSTPVIYVVPSVCELVCKTAALILSGSNLEKTTHQWASTMPSFPPPVLQSHHTWPRAETLSKLRDHRLQCMKSKQCIVTSHTTSNKWPVTSSVIIKVQTVWVIVWASVFPSTETVNQSTSQQPVPAIRFARDGPHVVQILPVAPTQGIDQHLPL